MPFTFYLKVYCILFFIMKSSEVKKLINTIDQKLNMNPSKTKNYIASKTYFILTFSVQIGYVLNSFFIQKYLLVYIFTI